MRLFGGNECSCANHPLPFSAGGNPASGPMTLLLLLLQGPLQEIWPRSCQAATQ